MSPLLGLYLPTLAISVAQGMIYPAVPGLAVRFGVSPALAAQVVTAQIAGRMLALLPAGALVDRVGPRRVLIIGSLVIVAASVLMFAPAIWGVLAAQALTGVGSSLWTIGREISGLHLVRTDQRGRLMSGFFGLQMAGLAAGPVAGGLVVALWGFRALFALFAVLGLGVLAASLAPAASPRSSRADATASAGAGPPAPARAGAALAAWRAIPAVNRTTFSIVVFATFAMSVFRSSVNSLLPVYAAATLGLDAAQIGGLFGIASIAILTMIVPAGWMLDRKGRKWAAVPSAGLAAAAFAVIPLARTPSHLAVVAAAFGVANGLSLGSMSTFSYDVIPPGARGVLQGVRRLLGDLGGLAGPLAGGLLASRCGAGSAFLGFAPLLALATVLLAFGARETLQRPPRTARPAAGGQGEGATSRTREPA